MVRVFLADLFTWRRISSSIVLCAVAICVAVNLPVAVRSWVYLLGVAATTTVSTWLLLASYYRTDRLIDYAQLPLRRSRLVLSLVLTAWLLLTVEILAPLAAFGLASRTLGWREIVASAALQGAVIACLLAYRTAAGRFGPWAASGAVIGLLCLGCLLVSVAGWWGAIAFAFAGGGLAAAWLATDPPYHLIRTAASEGRVRTSNYFDSVMMSDRVIVANGVLLTAFATVFTVMSLRSGLTYPLAYAIIAVSSPVSTMLSADKDTTVGFRMLGRPRLLTKQYTACLFVYFAIANTITLLTYWAVGWPDLPRLVVLAAAATVAEALLIPMLETRFPITGWKTSRDVWRHPRKYLLPGLILVMATVAVSA